MNIDQNIHRPMLGKSLGRWLLFIALAVLLLGAAARLMPARSASAAPIGLRVVGNHFVNGANATVQLRGVNRSGTEYACIQGWGIFDGPSSSASVAAIASWGVNEVRVPLNEDCWLGINGVSAALGGASYRAGIVNYVNLLNSFGIYAELSLMWSAPGATSATFSNQVPDSDHSPAFWTSVANTFKSNLAVLFGLVNEPHGVTATCWLNGGSACSGQVPYAVAGAQTLVNAIRATGAQNVIADQCVDYANDCSAWLSNHPGDPAGQLAAEFHEYGNNTCHTQACWNSGILAIATKYPVLTGELGETYDASSCGSSFVSAYMAMADAHGISYSAWVWDTWGDCEQLISNYNGTASGTGVAYRAHLLSLSTPPTGTPGVTNTPTHTSTHPPTATTPPTPTVGATSTPTPAPTASPSPTPSPASPGGSLGLVQAHTQFIDYSGINESYSKFSSPVHKGDLLVAAIAIAGGNSLTVDHVDDDLGNVWTRAAHGYNGDNSDAEIWYAVAKSSGPDEVDAYLVWGAEHRSSFAQTLMTAAEFSGYATGHGGTAHSSHGTMHTSGAVASQKGDLVVGMYVDAGYLRHLSIADGKRPLGAKLDAYDAINGIQSYGYSAAGGPSSATFYSSASAPGEVAVATFGAIVQ